MTVEQAESKVKSKGQRRKEKKTSPHVLPDYIPAVRPDTFPPTPKWNDPDAFKEAVDAYFDYCDKTLIEKQIPHSKGITLLRTPTPYTMAGLARALGVCRETLNKYKHQDHPLAETDPEKSQQFADIIYSARDRIHENNVNMALLGCHDAKIAELNLINNFGYSRKVELELPGGGAEINVVFSTDRTQKRIDDLEQKNLELMKKLNQIEHKPEPQAEGKTEA